jgi:hypothetical protein
MKLKKSDKYSENYSATVVEIDNLSKHPNADKLMVFEYLGGNVITGTDAKIGDKVIYFPIESSLNSEFVSWANLFDDPTLNSDGVSKGFFSAKGRQRVKPIKLRGIPSEGFIYPVSKLAEFYNVNQDIFKTGESFDSVEDSLLLEKWVSDARRPEQSIKKVNVPIWIQKLPRPIRKFVANRFYNKKDDGIKSNIVQGQFSFHYDTGNFAKSFFVLKPDDDITISDKWHGTSAVFSNILCYRRRKWWEKLLGLSVKRLSKEYKLIYSSRRVIKNRRDGKYTEDPWGEWADYVESKNIPEGVSLYAEIVGYVNHEKMIQKKYCYGYSPRTNGLHIYRITRVSPNGVVYEYSFNEIIEFCEEYGFKTTPVLYQGIAKDLFPDLIVDENWNKEFLKKVSEKYLEKNCQFCKAKVPAEGVVLKIESKIGRPVFKHKSFAFKTKESAERDAGETNIEEES